MSTGRLRSTAEDAGGGRKPCGGLDARLNFAWISSKTAATQRLQTRWDGPAARRVACSRLAAQTWLDSAGRSCCQCAPGYGSADVQYAVRGLRDRPGPAGAYAQRRADRRRAAGLRSAALSGAEPRARRQQGRAPGRRVGRADRLRIDPDQSHQRGAQGDRRQRGGQRLLRTIARKGFRFVGDVSEIPSSSRLLRRAPSPTYRTKTPRRRRPSPTGPPLPCCRS